MKRITKYLMFIITLVIFYILLIHNHFLVYNMTYTKTLILMISICIYLYIMGIVINNEKEYKINVYCYILLFLWLLYSFVFIIGRPLSIKKNFDFYMQLKPFYTISTITKYGSPLLVMKNITGNIIALIPFSFLLMIRSEKFNNILRQSLFIIPLILFIEFYQGYSHTGAFDVDDIILNYFGSALFTFIITRFDLIGKIRKLFYTDFHFQEKTKNILFYISTCLIIIIDILMFIK